MEFNEARVRGALFRSWLSASAVQWTPANPALGQCNVTAVVIFDLFGGDILRTRLGDCYHYYNRVDGRAVDLTDSQFAAPGALFARPDPYDDEPASRAAAMSGIAQREYDALRSALSGFLAD
ncbi:hypothetical protein [Breoghania sp. L-A4]|uniref:YunG family protein n=1 Tax=Breoghania sp. L-A4 TaxID=2304600 RepID=UPI000E358704|nr:hypothetical protein [Breoghania sp. L-A4]AXS41278.1 hypothetical protein D1F64_16165 [Breoghania sp. L-A4]